MPSTRAKRPRRPSALERRLAWEREMESGPGVFFATDKLPNWNNVRWHWSKCRPIQKRQKKTASMATTRLIWSYGICFPVTVKLTRYGPHKLDTDGLASSLKYPQDGVAAALDVDDGDETKVRWVREQELSRWCGVRIELATA